MSRRKWLQVFVLTVVTALLLVFSGSASAQGNRDNAFERVREVQERHTSELMARQGVVGTAISLDEAGESIILVLLEGPGVPGIPAYLEGVPVRHMVTGKFYASKPPTSSGKPVKNPPAAPANLVAEFNSGEIALTWVDKSTDETGFKIEREATLPEAVAFSLIATVGAGTTRYDDVAFAPSSTYRYRICAYNKAGQSAYVYSNYVSTPADAIPESPYPRPARIGISTGHPDITAGTIGCRVIDAAGNVYALSNNHVYANENLAAIGDNVLQPGPYDGGLDPRDAIGTLDAFAWINFNNDDTNPNRIDAAIALCNVDSVTLDNRTPNGSYGVPSSVLASAYVGQYVKKHGRTTGLTHGQVVGINTTITVGYDSAQALFTGQIVIGPRGFSKGGDSGSLIVTESGNHPVGLLFAGSTFYTIANPIDEVLEYFHVDVDDTPIP